MRSSESDSSNRSFAGGVRPTSRAIATVRKISSVATMPNDMGAIVSGAKISMMVSNASARTMSVMPPDIAHFTPFLRASVWHRSHHGMGSVMGVELSD